jgi:hypothetical protein
MESRIHGDVYVRFGGRHLETYRRKAARRRVSSLQNGDQDVKKTIIVLLINVKKNQGNQLILFHQTP